MASALFIFFGTLGTKLAAPTDRINYSSAAVDFLENYIRDNNQVNIFNYYAWGGDFGLRLPQLKIFIDGRMPHWKEDGNSAMEDYIQVAFKGNWEEVFARRKINLVFLKKFSKINTDFFGRATGFLFLRSNKIPDKIELLPESLSRSDWRIVYEDDVSIIMEKNK